MVEIKKTKYILHVSDFHLTFDSMEFAKEGLKCLSDALDNNDITIDYLIHTGDVIDAKNSHCAAAIDLGKNDSSLKWIAQEYVSNLYFDEEKFKEDVRTTDAVLQQINKKISENMSLLYLASTEIIKEFLADIRVRKRHTYFCVGNHDTLRPIIKESPPLCDRFMHDDGDAQEYQKSLKKYKADYNIFGAFATSFLNELGVWNSNLCECSDQTPDLNLVVLNTNHRNPKKSKEGYYCIDCSSATQVLNKFNTKQDSKRLNVVIAHKPIYEICEAARMSFSSYHKTEFLTAIHRFLGDNGVYICGDKHTRSVSDTTFHNIQHIIGGAPLMEPTKDNMFQVEYNLIEMIGGKIGNIQKVHLSYNKEDKMWNCVFRPEDSVVEKLYEMSSHSIIPQCLSVLSIDVKKNSWTDISRIFLNDKKKSPKWESLEEKLDKLYHIICKYGKMSPDSISNNVILKDWDSGVSNDSVFRSFQKYLVEKMGNNHLINQNNILNIRGEYSSGKSTFLGILYIYLLYQYSIGNINFIPAYFNLENKRILEQINCNNKVLYYEAATNSFKKFLDEVKKISNTSHQAVCYLIDGLDEQDVWSYSSEDSVGRGILDVLDLAPNSKNIMSYSQHHLPLFKNTMPERKYKDYSDVMYFNNVNIVSADRKKEHFKQFISAFYSLTNEQQYPEADIKECGIGSNEDVCALIRKFRRLSINQNFLYKFGNYIAEKTVSPTSVTELSVDEVYRNYIDLLHKMCMDTLGYGYVHFVPAMAYLFSFKGFTYERFKQIPPNTEDYWQNKIAEHSNKVYDAFIFIKKNQDIREYLIAMHYNRELRYYAENPEIPLSDTSILNEFISRNVAIISRKMWKSDPNKFVIVCMELLEKRRDLGQT